MPTSAAIQEINIAHSPDSDDAFMFYGLATNKVRVPGFKFNHTLTDIETLNQRAIHDPFYDVTAISFHAYPYMQETYTLMACGGSVGEGYGPMVVAPRKLSLSDVKKTRIAVPGTLTTAYLTLKLFRSRCRNRHGALRQDHSRCRRRRVRRRADHSRRPIDLRQQRPDQGARPRPMVARADRPSTAAGRQCYPRSLGEETMRITTSALRDSIQHALDHREEALEYAMQFARDLDPSLANKFVGMYVNERTLNYGEDGREAIRKLLQMGFDRGIIPMKAEVAFVG